MVQNPSSTHSSGSTMSGSVPSVLWFGPHGKMVVGLAGPAKEGGGGEQAGHVLFAEEDHALSVFCSRVVRISSLSRGVSCFSARFSSIGKLEFVSTVSEKGTPRSQRSSMGSHGLSAWYPNARRALSSGTHCSAASGGAVVGQFHLRSLTGPMRAGRGMFERWHNNNPWLQC